MKHSFKRLAAALILLPMLLASCSRGGNSRLTGTVEDIDGNRYGTIKIGNRTWMSENLRVSRYRNGDTIPELRDARIWSATTAGAWNRYEHQTENEKTFGKLYNWHAVNDQRGLAPKGWHVSTDQEWTELVEVLGGEAHAGAALKAPGKWSGPSTSTENVSGFNAIPAGARRDTDGAFLLLGEFARFWTATGSGSAKAYGRALEYYDGAVRRGEVKKANGFSVRCVQD
ncbi:MAG: hypothetical protein HGB35_08590 [Geobacteraceae bacterium]|nr:hypothetical protein [Geobacteraceae bacterium]